LSDSIIIILYSTFLNQSTEKLHRFYTKKSTFCHGTEGDDIVPHYGQQVSPPSMEPSELLKLTSSKCYLYRTSTTRSCPSGTVIPKPLSTISQPNHLNPAES